MPDRATSAGDSGGSVDPYRRTFVGRDAELAQLRTVFDAASVGNGGVILLAGEPGIGKTALWGQLAHYVSTCGGSTLVGHCFEETALSVPYLAFVEAMRAHVATRDDEGLNSDLAGGAAEVARIVPQVADRAQVDLRAPIDAQEDRWRLQQAVATFLRNAASSRPIVLILEDLHWANPGTLDLLLHVARNLESGRLLLLGTYRDTEVSPGHPLNSTLAELRRQRNFLRITLRGLAVEQVHQMYKAIRGQQVSRYEAELVHRQTEGNPLFVQEVLRYLVEENLDAFQAGADMAAGLRDVVDLRMSHLSTKAHQALSIAAVVGRDFRLDVLQRVTGWPAEELFSALEEAHERAIIETYAMVGTVGFRFAHAVFSETLYREIFAARRASLHQQVGMALEETYEQNLEEHSAELADHFGKSAVRVDLEKAVTYGELAARRAIAVFDYGEAARHLEQALEALKVAAPADETRRCDILLQLGEALLVSGPQEEVLATIAPAALSLAERLMDQRRAYAACCLGLDSAMPVLSKARFWLDAGEKYAEEDLPSQVRLVRARAVDLMLHGRGIEAKSLLVNALDMARRDRRAEWEFAALWGLFGITDLSSRRANPAC